MLQNALKRANCVMEFRTAMMELMRKLLVQHLFAVHLVVNMTAKALLKEDHALAPRERKLPQMGNLVRIRMNVRNGAFVTNPAQIPLEAMSVPV